MAIKSIKLLSNNSSKSIGKEQYIFQPNNIALISRFNNYKWRSPYLAHLTFFKYCILIQIKKRVDTTAFNLEFNLRHSKSSIYI